MTFSSCFYLMTFHKYFSNFFCAVFFLTLRPISRINIHMRINEIIKENGPDRSAPGPNQDHVERHQQYRPTWPAQPKYPPPQEYEDEEGFNKWWDSLPEERFQSNDWPWIIRLISTTYHIPAIEVTSWVTDYKNQPQVQADPTLDEPDSAGPYLYMRIVKWGRKQWGIRPLDVEPAIIDPNQHGGRARLPSEKYFDRDIDKT